MPIYKQNLNEADRVEGNTYRDYAKDAEEYSKSRMVGDKNDKFRHNLDNVVATTSTGKGGVLDSVAQNHIEKIKLSKEKALLESNNLLKDYKKYIDGHFNDVLNGSYNPTYRSQFDTVSEHKRGALEERMYDQYQALKKYCPDMDDKRIRNLVMDNFYNLNQIKEEIHKDPTIKTPEQAKKRIEDIIRESLKFRINYINKITNMLAEMLKLNYKELGLTEEQCKIYIEALNSGTDDATDAAGIVKQAIIDGRSKYSINDNNGFDFRPLGFGCIFGTSELLSGKIIYPNSELLAKFIQQAMTYDAVVVSHGGTTSIPKINRKLKKMTNRTTGEWRCQPIKTLNGGPFTKVNDVARQLIKEGFKKIMIVNCNPGHHELAKDIMDTPGVTFNYSNWSNWVESGEIDFKNNPEYLYIHEAEESLKEFAKSYDIDYDNDIYLVECFKWYNNGAKYEVESVNEGVIDSLKEFLKKIAAVIINIIKKILNFIKLGFQKIIQLFKGTKDSPKDSSTKFPEPVKTKLINPKTMQIEEIEGSTRDEICSKGKQMCNDMANTVKDWNDKQKQGLQQAQKFQEEMDKAFSDEGRKNLDAWMINKGEGYNTWVIGDDDPKKAFPWMHKNGDNNNDNIPSDKQSKNESVEDINVKNFLNKTYLSGTGILKI